MNQDDREGWVLIFIAGVILFLAILLRAQNAYPFELPDKEEACEKSAEAAQAFLQLTDEASQRSMDGPPRSGDTRRWATEQHELLELVEKAAGALEIYSSVCLGVEIYPHRLPEEWQEEYKKLMEKYKNREAA